MKKIKKIYFYSLLLLAQSIFSAENGTMPNHLKRFADELFLEQTYSIALKLFQHELYNLLQETFQAHKLTKKSYFIQLHKYLKHKETEKIELKDLFPKKENCLRMKSNIYSILHIAIEDDAQTNYQIARCIKRLITFRSLSKQQVGSLHKKLSKQLAITEPNRSLFHQYFPNEQMQQEDLIRQKTIALLRKITTFAQLFCAN